MTILLSEGDYVPDSSGMLKSLSGMEEVLQRVLIKLTARRGGFPLLPTLGSRLYLLLHQSPKSRNALAKQYVLEALSDETDLKVDDVTVTLTGDNSAQVTVALTWQGTALSVLVNVS
ncbi:MAG: hypothetical protein LUD79_02790 [Oscillospiraceae bacterium]|nr:hypothetical protein [Oscillospiraceae bacterium]